MILRQIISMVGGVGELGAPSLWTNLDATEPFRMIANGKLTTKAIVYESAANSFQRNFILWIFSTRFVSMVATSLCP